MFCETLERWLSELFKTGYKRPLETIDLVFLRQKDGCKKLLDDFWDAWYLQAYNLTNKSESRQVRQGLKKMKPMRMKQDEKESKKISKAIGSAFGPLFYLALPLKLIYDCTQYAGPYLLSNFIAYAASNDEYAREQSYIFFLFFFVFFVLWCCHIFFNVW